jgi:Fic family protein
MEPMVISESSRHRGRLNQLVFELTTVATAFKASLPDAMVEAVGDLVRSMNCYYSNLIEGHNTHPIDIEGLSKFETVLQTPAAHHRLLWIHPFSDGNGRVARFVSYAMLFGALDTGGIWSIARGLARNVDRYKGHLAECDLPRRNDLDGRGNLSEEALASFTVFFLETCIDQVQFMSGLMQPSALRQRILDWAREEELAAALLPRSTRVLAHILAHR